MSSSKVCVRCITFNHAQYITSAMDGFTMQQTSFPYVCCIIDDASTDGEQAVIQEYLSTNFNIKDSACAWEKETDFALIQFAQHKTNKNCWFTVLYLKYNHYSIHKPKNPYISEWQDTADYIAICEGDDHWTDPLKLQKQMDYMETHPNCMLCFTNAMVHYEDEERPDHPFCHLEERDYSGNELVSKWISPTASFVYRQSISPSLLTFKKTYPHLAFGDRPLTLLCASLGSVHALSECTCVYRKHGGGWTHFFDAEKCYAEARTWEYLESAFPQYKESLEHTMMSWYLLSTTRAIREKNKSVFANALWRGIIRHPILGIKGLFRLPQERHARHNSDNNVE